MNADLNLDLNFNSKSIFNSKYLFPIAFLGSIAGATVYSVIVIIFGDIGPVLSAFAGFAGCSGLVILEILGMKFGLLSRDSAPVSTIMFYVISGIFTLYIGSILLYFFINVGIGGSIKPIDVLSFDMFVSGRIGRLDILLAFMGAILAYLFPYANSIITDK